MCGAQCFRILHRSMIFYRYWFRNNTSLWVMEIVPQFQVKMHFSQLYSFQLKFVEILLQLLTQFERVIKRDYLSSDYETTEELLTYCGSSRGTAHDFTGFVPQLPWIPKTTAAVGLRLLELDASIIYTPEQKAEAHDEKKVEEALPVESPLLSLSPCHT